MMRTESTVVELEVCEQSISFDITFEFDPDSEDKDWSILKATFFSRDVNDYIEAPRWLIALLKDADTVQEALNEFIDDYRDNE